MIARPVFYSKRFSALGRLALTATIVAVVASRVRLEWIVQALAGVRAGWLCPAFAVYVGCTVLSAQATRFYLEAFGLARTLPAVMRANYASYFYSLIGEWAGGVSRYLEFSDSGRKSGPVLAVIAAERMGIAAAWGLLGAAGLVWDVSPVLRGHPFRAWGTAGGMILALFVPAIFHLASPRLRAAPGALWRALAYQFCCAASGVLFFMMILRSVGVVVPAPSLLWVAACVALGQLIPLTLMGLGVREGLLIVTLSLFGVPPATAVAAGLLTFAVTLFCSLAGGVWNLFRR